MISADGLIVAEGTGTFYRMYFNTSCGDIYKEEFIDFFKGFFHTVKIRIVFMTSMVDVLFIIIQFCQSFRKGPSGSALFFLLF